MTKSRYAFILLTSMTGAGVLVGIAVPVVRQIYGSEAADNLAANAATIFGIAVLFITIVLAAYAALRLIQWAAKT